MASDNNGKFVAGHYTATFNGADIGTTERGFDIRPQYSIEFIRVDDFGQAIVDGIYLGYNVRVSSQLSEWGATGRAALQFPFDTTVGTLVSIGQTLVGGGFAKQTVFTPIASINTLNKTYTFPLTVPDGDHGGWTLNTQLRKVDIRLLALVNRTTGVLWSQGA